MLPFLSHLASVDSLISRHVQQGCRYPHTLHCAVDNVAPRWRISWLDLTENLQGMKNVIRYASRWCINRFVTGLSLFCGTDVMLNLSICLFVCLSLSFFLFLSLSVSLSLSVCLSVCLSIYLFIYIYRYHTFLSIHAHSISHAHGVNFVVIFSSHELFWSY